MRLLVVVFAVIIATAARAGALVVSVRTMDGRPVPDAVITLHPVGRTVSASRARFPWPMRVAQQHKMFVPFVLIAPAGATVAFPNLDTVQHQVYSFSLTHPFEIKLYGPHEIRGVRFDRPGVIALGCSIHDQMIAFIKVVDTPYAAKTGADGEAALRNLPNEAMTLRIWHPYMKAPGNEQIRAVTIQPDDLRETVIVNLRAPPATARMY